MYLYMQSKPMHHAGPMQILCTLAGPSVFLSHYLTPSETSVSIALYNWFLCSPRVVPCQPYILWSPQGLFLCSIGKFNYIGLILTNCHYVHTLLLYRLTHVIKSYIITHFFGKKLSINT